MVVDWISWHREYADPDSPLSRRRRVVQAYLRTALAMTGPGRLLSLCAGDGVDVLEVLADQPAMPAVLVEWDPSLADRARALQQALGLPEVDVRTADAGLTATYVDCLPACVLVAAGVFGNVSDADLRRTVAALPGLVEPGGLLIWTRGRGAGPQDASQPIRRLLAEAGFDELDFTAPDDANYRVGLHRSSVDAATSALAISALPPELFRFR